MSISFESLKNRLCDALCTEVKLHQKNHNLFFVETPFTFEDGDIYSIYIKILNSGILRISDCGNTLMHLSYENNIENLRKGTRGKLFEKIIAGMEIKEDEGELYIDSPLEFIGENLFRLGQAITKINDLTFLNKNRAESTFYEDLQERLLNLIDPKKITKDYIYPGISNAATYPIDYFIKTAKDPLYIFGIPSDSKARLVQVVLQRLLREKHQFDSILVFADQSSINRSDLVRLSDAGGEMVSSLDAKEDLQRKIQRKIDNV